MSSSPPLNDAQAGPDVQFAFSKNPPMPPAPCHDVLTVTDEPGPAGATVQLITIVELASLSIRCARPRRTCILTSRTHDLVDCSFHIATHDPSFETPDEGGTNEHLTGL